MKLIRKTLIKDSSGSVTLVPEEGEDMWHLYNLLQKGNVLEAVTFRQFVLESAIGTTEKTTHKINLKATVESLFFDTQATILRVNCRNIAENKYIKIGAYHTIDLELNRPLTISKDEWDSISLERIENACNVANRADLAAVLLQEGIATVCLVTSNMTIVRQKIESTIPKKRRGTSTDYDKGMARFFGQILNAILHHVDFQIVKVLIIASPGFTKDGLYKFLLDQAVKQDLKQIFENKSKIILLHSSSGFKHALAELLQDPSVQNQLADTKFAQEVNAINSFYKMLSSETEKAFYGYEHCSKAANLGAVQTLMVTDSLFKSDDISERKKYIALVELCRSMGAKVLIFSALHTSGEQLAQLTGIAALLNFPLPELCE